MLGGFGDTPEKAAAVLQKKFPNLKIAGTANPVIARPASGGPKQSISQINSSGAAFLFVALGPITQEKWIYQNLPNLRVNPVTAPEDKDPEYRLKTEPASMRRSNGVKLAIGLGGTFDYLAQKRLYRPQIWALRGLEWLWRLLTQPCRAWRITKGVLGLIYYCYKVKIRS